MKLFKIEYFPDREGDEEGRKCFTIQYSVNNWKRFEGLSNSEKKQLMGHIERFEETLTILKTRLMPNEPEDKRSVATKPLKEQKVG